MNNVLIKEVDCHKHLGLIFNNKGTWSEHIKDISTKAWKRLNIMRKFKFILDRSSLQKIYFTFIRPLLEYADIIWDNCTINETEDIEKIQLEAARIVTGTTKLVSIRELYQETGWEKLETRRQKHKLIKFYSIVSGQSSTYLQELIPQEVSQTSDYNLRNSNNIRTVQSRTTLYENSFFPSAIKKWNALPLEERNSNSLSAFKATLTKDITYPPKYYFAGTRKGQVLHTRIRTGCSAVKQHLHRRNIINDPFCSCGMVEDAEHFLLQCPLYSQFRRDMFRYVAQFCPPTVNILLYGDPDIFTCDINASIFLSVQNFILNSKRFDS